MYLNYDVINGEITARGIMPQTVADLMSGCDGIVAANADGARRTTMELLTMLLSDLADEHGLDLKINGGPLNPESFTFTWSPPQYVCYECCAVSLNDCLHI